MEVRLASLESARSATEEKLNKDMQGLLAEQNRRAMELEALKKRLQEMDKVLEGLKSEMVHYRETKTQLGMIGDRINQFHNRLAIMESNVATASPKRRGGEVVIGKSGNITHEAVSNEKMHKDMAKLYDDAYLLFKQKRFSRARADFAELLKRFPNSEFSADAVFWIAESYFLERKDEEAILEYEKVIKKYPNNKRIPEAMLKQGMAFARIGDVQSARIIFQRIIQMFPGSASARNAQKELEKVN